MGAHHLAGSQHVKWEDTPAVFVQPLSTDLVWQTNTEFANVSRGRVICAQRMKKKWLNFFSGYKRHALILVSGSVLAQGLLIGTSPILTRLYDPAAFGLFALFMAIVGALNPVVCGKLDVALVLPKKDEDSAHLTGLAIQFVLGVSLLLFLISVFFHTGLKELLKADRLGIWYYLTAVGLLLSGGFQVFSGVSNRFQQYTAMARSNVLRAVANTLVKIGGGCLHLGLGGLIAGQLVGLIAGMTYLFAVQKGKWTSRVFARSPDKKRNFIRYKDFPLYNASSGVLGGLLLSLPVFFIAHRYSEDLLGQFALTVRVVMMPSVFLSVAISQVNLKRVVDLVNARRSALPFVLKSSAMLGAIVILPMLVLWFWGAPLFVWAFGAKWAAAGKMAAYLSGMITIRFVASTMSSVLAATRNNGISAVWRIVTLCTMTGVFAWSTAHGDIYFCIKAYAVHDAVMYSIIWLCTCWAAAHPKNHLEGDATPPPPAPAT
ncbi:MAG: O-antigen/teichoic acid export membrane protein [Kiritimatiellia bacterium]|jgi:O-antigen/teichoic acid export membrane protein